MLQKYRADNAGPKNANGSVPWYANWMGGPTLSLIRNCPTPMGKRTVYITNEPDTFFTIPAACRYKGKDVRGYVTSNEDGYIFNTHHCRPTTRTPWNAMIVQLTSKRYMHGS